MGNDYCCNFLIDVMLVVEILDCVPQNIEIFDFLGYVLDLVIF